MHLAISCPASFGSTGSVRACMIVGIPARTPGPRDTSDLGGVLERVTFANPETGYTIARIDPGRGGPDLITAVGLMGTQVGESLRMRGPGGGKPDLLLLWNNHGKGTASVFNGAVGAITGMSGRGSHADRARQRERADGLRVRRGG
jgi:hypothetical protein